MIDIPDEYANDLAEVKSLQTQIETNDAGLSDLAIMSGLCDIGNRTLLVIGISGTGKSTVAYWIRSRIKRNVIMEHGITTNGLKQYIEQLDNNSTSIIVEDLSRSGSGYMQINTIAVLAGLVYTGEISKHNATLALKITNMRGSALIYGQPLIMKKLVQVPEFESDISDKTLRYYHLVKPSVPRPEADPQHPTIAESKGKWESIDRKRVDFDAASAKKYWDKIIDNLTCEVSLARAIEHAQALIKASALMNGRTKTIEADAYLVWALTCNARIEEAIYSKQSLEGVRYLDEDLLPLLTVLASIKSPNVKDISKAFRLKQSQTYEILKRLGTWVQLNGGKLYATKDTKKLLREMGVH